MKGQFGCGAGGGAVQGIRGEWIRGLGKNFGTYTTVKAELKVVLRGLCDTFGRAFTFRGCGSWCF